MSQEIYFLAVPEKVLKPLNRCSKIGLESHGLAELCVSDRLTIFIQKTFSFPSQITFILIEGYFNWSVRYFDNNLCLT
ncbi:MAG: hypothetical protein MGF17_12840 [Trichodesmium sp. MAG_R04]|nr:hypothetical protein [Trichodesmium sp. MAG_R04]